MVDKCDMLPTNGTSILHSPSLCKLHQKEECVTSNSVLLINVVKQQRVSLSYLITTVHCRSIRVIGMHDELAIPFKIETMYMYTHVLVLPNPFHNTEATHTRKQGLYHGVTRTTYTHQ